MNGTKPWAIFIVIICTLFTSIGALFLKKGVDALSFSSLQGLLDGYLVIVGLFFYFLGFILLTISFKHGELSVLFPFVSLSFVWVAFLSAIFLAESITTAEIGGIASIVIGVTLVGLSSRSNKKLRLRG